MIEKRVAVLGATSLVGECMLALLVRNDWRVTALSRRRINRQDAGIEWRCIGDGTLASSSQESVDFNLLICLAPIWVLSDYMELLDPLKIRRVVALSSTSRFTKESSSDPEEQAIALRLAESENRFILWAEARGVEWVILRPTLIYGLGRDKNIAEIARFIRRFGFFPLFGKASGLRQPIHAQDVAGACLAALQEPAAANRAYNISGGETLSYRDMVARIFITMGRRPRLASVPLVVFRVAVRLLRLFPRFRHWTVAMAERMNRDLVFDHSPAMLELAFKPMPFVPSEEDMAQ